MRPEVRAAKRELDDARAELARLRAPGELREGVRDALAVLADERGRAERSANRERVASLETLALAEIDRANR